MKPNKVCSVYSIYNERATTGVNSMDKTHKANSILMKKGAIYLSRNTREANGSFLHVSMKESTLKWIRISDSLWLQLSEFGSKTRHCTEVP